MKINVGVIARTYKKCENGNNCMIALLCGQFLGVLWGILTEFKIAELSGVVTSAILI